MTTKVDDIASTHSGDKGDRAQISVFVYDPADWPLLRDGLTEAVVAQKFAGFVLGEVRRYELPTLHGLNFELTQALSGGTSGLRMDGWGKTYQSIMLDVELAQ